MPALALVFSGPAFTLYNASVNVSWGTDLFGAARRTVEAQEAGVEAQAFQLEATYLALIPNVVTASVQEASLRAQIDVTKEMIQTQQQFLHVLQRQNAAGQIGQADVSAQETALAQTRLLLLPLEKQMDFSLFMWQQVLGMRIYYPR
jgi:outer membrane protein TolC